MKRILLLLASAFILYAGSGCYKKVTIPVADFSFKGSNDSIVPDTVTFRNLSQNASSYEWSFGDSHSSTATDPVHIYTAKGSFDVILKAYSDDRQQWATKTHKVIIQ
jgi:PKD repeat protein